MTTQREVERALRLVSMALPHLSGLAAEVTVTVDERIPTAAIFASGRMLINPGFASDLDRKQLMFVLAHELLHLAMRTHARAEGSDMRMFNIAHDYVINDMLSEALNMEVPAGGLEWRGARDRSAEIIIDELKEMQKEGVDIRFRGAPSVNRRPKSAIEEAMEKAGLRPKPQSRASSDAMTDDVLADDVEHRLFPSMTDRERELAKSRIEKAAARAASLGALRKHIDEALNASPDQSTGNQGVFVQAVNGFYRPPWELALQQWVEALAPGPRSFARPSRRGSDRGDVVLPGHKREGWILNIVLDTSGSMESEFATVLGMLASFAESANVSQVRVLQCDAEVTADEHVTPDRLR
jgi:hypothetical protein